MSNKIVIGSRESKLAVLQSQMVQDFIVQNHPDMEVDILTMKTTGDKILGQYPGQNRRQRPFCKRTGHGPFWREEASCLYIA